MAWAKAWWEDPKVCQCMPRAPTWRREISLKSYYIPMTIPLADAGIFAGAPGQSQAKISPGNTTWDTESTGASSWICVEDGQMSKTNRRSSVECSASWRETKGAISPGLRQGTNCMRNGKHRSLARPRRKSQTKILGGKLRRPTNATESRPCSAHSAELMELVLWHRGASNPSIAPTPDDNKEGVGSCSGQPTGNARFR